MGAFALKKKEAMMNLVLKDTNSNKNYKYEVIQSKNTLELK